MTDKLHTIAVKLITISNHAFASTQTELNFLTLIFFICYTIQTSLKKKGSEPLLGLNLTYQFENEMSHKTMRASSDIIAHL